MWRSTCATERKVLHLTPKQQVELLRLCTEACEARLEQERLQELLTVVPWCLHKKARCSSSAWRLCSRLQRSSCESEAQAGAPSPPARLGTRGGAEGAAWPTRQRTTTTCTPYWPRRRSCRARYAPSQRCLSQYTGASPPSPSASSPCDAIRAALCHIMLSSYTRWWRCEALVHPLPDTSAVFYLPCAASICALEARHVLRVRVQHCA